MTIKALITCILIAASPIASAGLMEQFIAKTYASPKGGKLLYRQLDPANAESDKKYPLILLLHGAGGRGEDNTKQLKDAGVIHLLEKIDLPKNYPCYVIAPQVPQSKRWVEVHWGLPAHTMPVEPGDQMRMTLELVDDFIKKNPIDTNRIYVTGLSMGGFGTWDAIQRRPDFFAAAVPVCGGGDTAEAPKLTKLPIWIFHGDKDQVVKTQRSRDMFKAIKDAGGNPTYTEVPNTSHASWTAAYSNKEMWAWMFDQTKPKIKKQSPSVRKNE